MEQGLQLFGGCFWGMLGLLIGSFLNCTAYRIVRGQDFVHGRSRCPHCGHELSAKDLVPVWSYVFLRGRCRYCEEKISVRYLMTELLFMGVTLILYFHQGATVLFCRNLLFTACLFGLSMVDWECYRIPDGFLLCSALVWGVSAPLVLESIEQFFWHIAAGIGVGGGMLFLSLLFDRILGKESMGGGDIKLFAVAALYLGGAASVPAVFFSCVFGLLIGIFKKKIPLAPAISLSVFLMLLYGRFLVDWYIKMVLGIVDQ